MNAKNLIALLAIVSIVGCAEDPPDNPSNEDANTVSARHGNMVAQANANSNAQQSAAANSAINASATQPTAAAGSTVFNPAITMPMPMPVTPGTGTPGTGTPGTGTPGGGSPVTGTPITTTPANPAPAIETSFQYLPVLADTDGDPNNGTAVYNLSAEANVSVNVSTTTGSWSTPMMRFNGMQLPPVIKAKRGTNIIVNMQNNLTEDTTIHWHGFKIPAIQDGGPDSPIAPGASRIYSFQLVQAAAPLWFHPHAHGSTATQVYNGLAGAFVVTDDITESLEANNNLPSGSFDIPLLIQDRSFAPDNATGVRPLVYNAAGMAGMLGMLGDIVLVNGVEQPSLKVVTRQYRFRIFNGSNARTYDFALSNGATFNVIGTDGGLLPSPIVTDHILLAAGERAEIVIDFRSTAVNDSLALINRALSNLEIMRFDVTGAVADDVELYTSLPANADIFQRLTAADANNARDFVMSMGSMMGAGGMGFVINGKVFDINRVDELVTAGTTEIWNISNTSGIAHPFHAHAIQWQILDRNNIPASGIDLGWKDTVLVQPGETVRFIGRFDPVINKGLYMYHCHILEHEEAGMMGTFQIL